MLEFCIRRGEIDIDIEQGIVVNERYLDDNIFLGFGSTISCSNAGFCHAARARSRSDGGEIAVPQAEHLPLSAQHEARVQDRLPCLQPSIRTPGEPTKIPH